MMFAHVTLNGEADESDPVLKPLERPRKRDFSGRKVGWKWYIEELNLVILLQISLLLLFISHLSI